jgi:hypothetical protein
VLSCNPIFAVELKRKWIFLIIYFYITVQFTDLRVIYNSSITPLMMEKRLWFRPQLLLLQSTHRPISL